MTISIRVAQRTDIGRILDIERSTPDLPHWPQSEYERYIALPETALDRVIFVAEQAETTVGFAAAALPSLIPQIAELESIAVLPSARGAGIGRELCRRVIHWSRDRAAAALELEVRSRSAGAVALYRSLGFRVVGTRTRYYADPADDALLMALTL